MARNRYSGSIKPPSACTLEFHRFGVSDVSLTLSQFRGGDIRHAWLTARENSSLIYLIDPTYIYTRKREGVKLLFLSFPFLSSNFSKPLFAFDSITDLLDCFLWIDMKVEHLPALSTALSGYLHPRCKPRINRFACRMRWHTGSHQQGRTTWFFTASYGNDLDILSFSLSLSLALSRSFSLSLSLHEDGRVVKS